MRAKLLILAAGVFALTIGCGQNNTSYYPQEEAVAIGPPRVNLYPLTAPPPESGQPLQGYAPTRISTAQTQYAPPAYGGGTTGGYVPTGAYAQTGYASGGGVIGVTEPFPTGSYCPPWVPAGTVCTVENMTAGMNPIVPIGDPPVIINNVNTGQSYTTTMPMQSQPYAAPTYAPPTYMAPTYAAPTYPTASTMGYSTQAPVTVPASYSPPLSATTAYGQTVSMPSAPGMEPFPTGSYCPPWAPAGANCTVENMTAGMNPMVPIGDPPVIVNNTYVSSPAPMIAPTAAQPSSFGAAYPGQPLSAVGSVVPASYTVPQQETALASAAPVSGVALPRATQTIPASGGSVLPVAAGAAYNASELRLVPALDVPPGNRAGDVAPSQWFEIVRPGNGPIRIGRVSSTCVCVSVRVPNRFVAAGERALVEARIVSRPPVNNLTYGIYVGVAEPVQTTLDADVTITLR